MLVNTFAFISCLNIVCLEDPSTQNSSPAESETGLALLYISINLSYSGELL